MKTMPLVTALAVLLVLALVEPVAPCAEVPAPSAPAPPAGEAKAPADGGAPAATPQELDRFLAAWAEAMKDLKTLELRFHQEKKLKILRRPLLSRGTILFSMADKKIRCTVLGPDDKPESDLVAGEGTVRILYPGLKKLEIYDLGTGAAAPMAFPGIGGDVGALQRDYTMRLERTGSGDRLTLVPRDAASPIRELRLVLKDFAVKELYQADATGGSVRLTVDEFHKNPALAPGRLDLAVPPGTEEVRPLGAKKQAGPAKSGE